MDKKPTLLEIDGNIRIAREWEEAIRCGTFPGAMAIRVATLLDFLAGQRKHNESELEKLVGQTAKVEFGRKPEGVVA